MMKLQKSYVCLEHLRFHAYHGVFQQERMVGNDYDVSLRLGYPLATAMQSDRVEDTLNYATVFQLVKEEMENGRVCGIQAMSDSESGMRTDAVIRSSAVWSLFIVRV